VAARPFGGQLTITATTAATAQSLTTLLRALHGADHRPVTFATCHFHADFDNANRIYIVFEIGGTKYDVKPLIPNEPLDFELNQGALSSDSIFFRAESGNDQVFVAGVET
jgi:hypothetical protein